MLGTGEMNCIFSSKLKHLVNHFIIRFFEMLVGECYMILSFVKYLSLFIIDYWNTENNARTTE